MKPRTRIPRSRQKPRRKRPELCFIKRQAIEIYPGSREVCRLTRSKGRAEYRRRVEAMLERQQGLCCNCRKPLAENEATFEHENGRGAGKRDDRIEVDGKPINGASHMLCNYERGSKRTPIWHGEIAA